MDIRCNVTLSDDVDTSITITRQWFGPTLLTSGFNYNITGGTLRINQLSVLRDHSRTIICLVTVIPSAGYPYVLQNSVNGSTQLSVEGELDTWLSAVYYYISYVNIIAALSNNLFTPDIIISGVPTAGDNFNIICRLAGVVERLVGTQTISLSFFNTPGGAPGDQSQDGSAYIIPRFFNPVMTGDVGTYTCVAIVIPSSWGLYGSTSVRILQIRSNVTL